MRFAVSTIRNGRQLCGNIGHLAAVWTDLNSLRGAIARAHEAARFVSNPGDMIVIERAFDDRPYEFNFVHSFIHYA